MGKKPAQHRPSRFHLRQTALQSIRRDLVRRGQAQLDLRVSRSRGAKLRQFAFFCNCRCQIRAKYIDLTLFARKIAAFRRGTAQPKVHFAARPWVRVASLRGAILAVLPNKGAVCF